MIIGRQTTKFFTPSDSVNAYLSDIKKFTVPTAEEERELIIRAQNGDDEAKGELINRNQRLLYSMAKIYARNESEVLDYVNEGTFGMDTAIDNFSFDKKVRLTTFASWYIRRSMNSYMNLTRNMVKRSNNLKIGNKVDKIKEREYATTGRVPTLDEIADILSQEPYNLDVKDLRDLYDINISSINAEVDEDYTMEDDPLYNEKTCSYNEYESESENDHLKSIVEAVISKLPPKKAEIIKKMFGVGGYEEHTIVQLADEYGMSESAIEKIRGTSFEYLRNNVSVKEVL